MFARFVADAGITWDLVSESDSILRALICISYNLWLSIITAVGVSLIIHKKGSSLE